MTKTEIHLALAGIDGWYVAINPNYAGDAKCHCVKREGGEWVKCPNYDSLDVLHEMWCKLTKEQHARFRVELALIVERDGHVYGPCRSLSNASASQRQEALLRVHNQWKDEK